MIKQLRKRICILLSAVLIIILAIIELYLYWENCMYQRESEEIFLSQIADQVLNGTMDTSGEEVLFEGLPIVVFRSDDSGRLVQLAGENNTQPGYDDTALLAEKIVGLQETSGSYDRFRYLYEKPVLVLYDESEWNTYNREIIKGMLIVFLAASIVVAGVAAIISKWLTRPVQKAFEQQKQFVSDASHELKTPLAIIGANAQRLNQEIGDNQWLGHILKENKRMGKLLEELLILARMESTLVDNGQEKFDLSRALTGALLPYESEAYEKGIHFYMDIEEECIVTGQEEHLKQAAIILVDNALHHVCEGGNLWVRLSEKRDRVILEVANTGKEIPEEERKKIFQRFYQSDKAAGRRENRHGLGLAIASAIASRHRGKITVDCQNGITTFSLIIRKN